MVRPNPYAKAMLKSVENRLPIDRNAYRLVDMTREWGWGQHRAAKAIREKMATGEWEQVWKLGEDHKLTRAYRIARKK